MILCSPTCQKVNLWWRDCWKSSTLAPWRSPMQLPLLWKGVQWSMATSSSSSMLMTTLARSGPSGLIQAGLTVILSPVDCSTRSTWPPLSSEQAPKQCAEHNCSLDEGSKQIQSGWDSDGSTRHWDGPSPIFDRRFRLGKWCFVSVRCILRRRTWHEVTTRKVSFSCFFRPAERERTRDLWSTSYLIFIDNHQACLQSYFAGWNLQHAIVNGIRRSHSSFACRDESEGLGIDIPSMRAAFWVCQTAGPSRTRCAPRSLVGSRTSALTFIRQALWTDRLTWEILKDGGDKVIWIHMSTMVADCLTKSVKPDLLLQVLRDNVHLKLS